jgi:dihydrofolate synthase/folylpolyglutamate synthase
LLAPDVVVLTTIALDHTEILGDTIEKIAFEKAGIIKPGVPVVAPTADPEALRVIEDVARERGSPIISIDGTVLASADPDDPRVRRVFLDGRPWRRWMPDPTPRVGIRELGNVEKALTVLKYLAGQGVTIPGEAVERGFAAARWPGRFERCPGEPRLLWDGAHNAQAMLALQRAWQRSELPVPQAVVLALSRDKDLERVLDPLARLAGGRTLLATRSRSQRAMDPDRIAAAAVEHGFAARVSPSVESACREALAMTPAEDLTLLTGSLFAIGEAMEAFGGAPGEWL